MEDDTAAEARTGELVLYSTSACHLCEQATALIEEQRAGFPALRYRSVDISDSDELFHRYGLRIPVLRRPDGAELGWPFDAPALREFLGDLNS